MTAFSTFPLAPVPGSETFESDAGVVLDHMPTFVSEANAFAADIQATAVATTASQVAAAASAATAGTSAATVASAAATATAAANFKGSWSALTGALNIPASVLHNGQLWLLTSSLANVTTATPGVSSAWYPLVNLDIADRAPIQPSLDLDFARQRYRVLDGAVGLREIALSDILTYTGSGRTYTGARGTLVAQASNVPRITFDPVTGAGLGLSVWGARTNLVTYSEQFGNAAWSKARCTVTENSITAPDGTMTADEIVENSESSAAHYLSFAVSALSGVVTLSVWGKSSIRSLGFLGIGGTTQRAAFFNLAAGTSHVEQVGGMSPPDISQSIESYAGGWYRCSMTWTADGQTSVRITTDGGLSNGNSAGSGSMYLWGAQLEAASSASPYIPTTTSAVTAPSDIANITGSNFSKWFNQSEGTLVVIARNLEVPPGNRFIWALSDGTIANYLSRRVLSSGSMDYLCQGSQLDTSNDAPATGITTSSAAAWSPSGFADSTKGAPVVSTAYTGLPPGINQLQLGGLVGGSVGATLISRILYFPRALPSNLQALSA